MSGHPNFIFSQNISIPLVAGSDNELLPSGQTLAELQLGVNLDEVVVMKFLKNPQIEVFLRTIPVTPFPEELTSQLLTDLERNLYMRSNEWTSQHNVYLEVKSRVNNNWLSIGSLIALNRDNSPYPLAGVQRAFKANTDNIVELGGNGKLAIQLTSTQPLLSTDRITFTGIYEERIWWKPQKNKINSCENQSWTVPTTGMQILPEQSNRASFRIQNNGNTTVWLNLGQLSGAGTGDPIAPGSFREYSSFNNLQYTLPIWLIATTRESQVSGVTCFY